MKTAYKITEIVGHGNYTGELVLEEEIIRVIGRTPTKRENILVLEYTDYFTAKGQLCSNLRTVLKQVKITDKEYSSLLKEYFNGRIRYFKENLVKEKEEGRKHHQQYWDYKEKVDGLVHYYKNLLNEKLSIPEKKNTDDLLKRAGF